MERSSNEQQQQLLKASQEACMHRNLEKCVIITVFAAWVVLGLEWFVGWVPYSNRESAA